MARRQLTGETAVQIAVVKWFKLQYPKHHKRIMQLQNEGKRSVAGHKISVAMGLFPGASDLFISVPMGGYHGLWVELKRKAFRKSENPEHVARQIDFIEDKIEIGFAGGIRKGSEDAIEFIRQYMNGNLKSLNVYPYSV